MAIEVLLTVCVNCGNHYGCLMETSTQSVELECKTCEYLAVCRLDVTKDIFQEIVRVCRKCVEEVTR